MPDPLVTTNRLRTVAMYQAGHDLAERLRTVAEIQAQMREAVALAADEIDRLNARIAELETHAATHTNA